MCIYHCYIKESDIEHLNNLGVNINYKERWSIIYVLLQLTNIEAINYILEKHMSSFEYYSVDLNNIVDVLNISEKDKIYLKHTFQIDYENFDVNVLEKCLRYSGKSEEEFFSDIFLKLNDTQIIEFINWFSDSDYESKPIISLAINNLDINKIKYVWEKLEKNIRDIF